MSTTDYLVRLIDQTLRHLENKQAAVTLCLVDFSKAFDRVNHTIAVRKMTHMGLRSPLSHWLCSFLEDRTQQVSFRGSLSGQLPVTCGLPQGTKVGPLLFLCMINDAALSTDLRYKYMYVDDLTILERHSSMEQSAISEHITNLKIWADKNDMQINEKKSAVMHVNFSRSAQTQRPVLVGETALPVINSVKILGVNITSDMKWEEHVKAMKKKASKRLHMLCLAKRQGIPLISSHFNPKVLRSSVY